ncbi:MAG: phosphate ABC transporter permease PstA [Thermoleophilia bacterium]|nr:phosphate ABC transporter permease PstA [Thermoleophilia bacterium]
MRLAKQQTLTKELTTVSEVLRETGSSSELPMADDRSSVATSRWAAGRLKPGGSLRECRPARRRVWRNRINTWLVVLAVLVALTPVALILYHITRKGLVSMSWEFLTSSMPLSFRKAGGGFLNALVGTAIMVALATGISVPLGILGAVYLVEYGKGNWLAKLIRFFSDVMSGVPSVFVGLFVYTALVVQFGFGALMGAASLALIMIPIVVRSTEEMLKLVPNHLKEASYALGAAKWQTILKVVLPAAAPGITTGVMLAIARAAGETAPLILTALGSYQLTAKLWGEPISALTLAIFDGARNPFAAGQARAWAGALELLAIVLICTAVARLIAARSRLNR